MGFNYWPWLYIVANGGKVYAIPANQESGDTAEFGHFNLLNYSDYVFYIKIFNKFNDKIK